MSPEIPCARCGRPVLVDPEAPGVRGSVLLRRMAESLLASGERPWCEECVDAVDREEAARSLAAARLERVRARRGVAQIPALFADVTWADLDVDEERRPAIETARRWGAGEMKRPGLLLYGPVGRGKTRIAATAALQRLERERVRWLNVAALLADLRMSFTSPEYQRAVRAFQPDPGVTLVLDDLDKIPPTETAAQWIYVAVNNWVEARRPLLLTSNKDPEGIAADFGPRFGAAIVSRLLEHCNVYPVGGRDRRTEP